MDDINTSSTGNGLTGLTPEVGTSELDSGITTGLAAVDTLSTSRLDNLGLVYQARVTQLTRTVNKLTAQYGSGAAQVIAAAAAVTATQTAGTRVLMVKQQTTEVAPVVTSTGWAVWGHVYDSNSNPLSRYCVFLVDAQKNYQQSYGFQFTDDNGAYAINYAGAPAQDGQTPAAPANAYLAATNAKAQLVFESSKPLVLTLGSALYVDITLPVGEPVLGDLPTEIERVAQPNPNAK
jgi:hypothetical protein